MANQNGDANGILSEENLKTCAVLGGRGFIGRTLVARLLKLGWIVRVVDDSKSLELSSSESFLSEALVSGRVSYFHADVREKPQIVEAINGVSVVFYTECADTLPQDFILCYSIVVEGTKNVIAACQECGVRILMYNSSADVVFDDIHDIHNGDESLPYSGRYWDMLYDFRSHAEALILRANDFDGLLTCALRPSNVFGPGDQFLPMLVNIARSFWAKFIIGSGQSESDFTYVENVAHAHICAVECLNAQKLSLAGKAFFVTNLEPLEFWEFSSCLLEGLGYQRPAIHFPVWAIPWVLSLMKFLSVVPNSKEADTDANLFRLAVLASRTRTFSCSAAQERFKYSPVVPLEEAVKLTIDSSNLAINSLSMRDVDSIRQSKVERLLGSGKVASVLLWRDEKETFISFLSLALLYLWFFLSDQTFVSSAARLLLLALVILCGHYLLPLTGYSHMLPRLSSSWFEVSEADMRNHFLTMNSLWHEVEHQVTSLAQGEDWTTFFRISAILYICKLIIPKHLTTTLGLLLVLSFTLCFAYEQYEDKIDGIASVAFSVCSCAITLLLRKLPTSLHACSIRFSEFNSKFSFLSCL